MIHCNHHLFFTYKLMFKSDQIAVGYESKYNYMLRTESISNSSFSPSKLIYPEVTDATCDEIVKKYPDLSDAAIARRVHSRFGVLNLMIYKTPRVIVTIQIYFLSKCHQL